MERFVKYIFKALDFGTEAKKYTASLDRFMGENYNTLQHIMNEGEVSAHAFLELYNERTFDIQNKQDDIKFMKTLDFKGLYLIKNLSKKKYYLGYGDKVFRKVDRHFKGYGNQEIYDDFKRGNTFVVSFGKYDSDAYASIELYEKESRVYLQKKLEGYAYYGKDIKNQTTQEQNNGNSSSNVHATAFHNMNQYSDKDLKKKRLKAFLFNRKKIALNVSAAELVGTRCDEATKILTQNGFTNIIDNPMRDIYVDRHHYPGEVEYVLINGNNKFMKNEMFSYDAEIIVGYHLKKQFVFPYSLRQAKKKNCHELAKELSDIGFTSVNLIAIQDLKTGWIVKENSIEAVTICKKEDYKKGQLLNYDVDIEICYHTFK